MLQNYKTLQFAEMQQFSKGTKKICL